MITKTHLPAEKAKNFFFLISKKNSFSSKSFAKNTSNEPRRSSVRQKLVPVAISKEEHFRGGDGGGGGLFRKQDSVQNLAC